MLSLSFNGFTMPSLDDLLIAAPRLEVLDTIIWCIWGPLLISIKHIFVPIGIWVISNLNPKERLAMTQHLIGGILCLPYAYGMGHVFPVRVAAAMARHGRLVSEACELEFEIEDMTVRGYEIFLVDRNVAH